MYVVILWNAAHFPAIFRIHEVCTIKLSHLRGSLQCTNNGTFGPR
jgi:hypothetical protein